MLREYNQDMTEETTELLKKALALPERERADLACTLMDSLDAAVDHEVEAAWSEEIARRIRELESGAVKAIPWEEVRRRISAKLANGR